MIRLFLGMVLALAPVSWAIAAELPDFDLHAVCARFAATVSKVDQKRVNALPEAERTAALKGLEQIEQSCVKLELNVRRQLEKTLVDQQLVTYCTAEANFWKKGYVQMLTCQMRIEHERQVEKVDNAFRGLTDYCVTSAPPGPSGEKQFQQCLERERISRLEFRSEERADSASDLGYCIAKVKSAGRSYDLLRSCLRERKLTTR